MRFPAFFAASSVLTTTALLLNCSVREQSAPEQDAGIQPDSSVDAPKPPSLPVGQVVLDLGAVNAGDLVPVTIPIGALGFNITAEGSIDDFDEDKPFGINRIVAPDGTVVHDAFMAAGGTQETSIVLWDVIAAASVPQSENVPNNLAGTWKLQFGVHNGDAKPKLNAQVRVQATVDGAFHGGTLDLHLYVPLGLSIGKRTLDPNTVATDPDIATRLNEFFRLTTELLGVTRGKVTFSLVGPEFSRLDGAKELQRGFAVSSKKNDGTQALNVLLTNVIANNGVSIAVGLAPGIPGAANRFGSAMSGLLIVFSGDAMADALTMFHEMGHFVGLSHTTEFSGDASDPLAETPVCNSIGKSKEEQETCPDRNNVMFPAGSAGDLIELTPTQKRVYRGSPIYKANVSGEATMTSLVPLAPLAPLARHERMVRLSRGTRLSPVEQVLAAGWCGLTPLNPEGLVARFGRESAIAQLRAAAADADLVPYIRGRATLALKKLGAH
jgi:hypothetical protein